MDEKFSSGLLAKYAKEHGGIRVGRNGGIRDGAVGFYGGSSIDLSKITDDMLLGDPFKFDWETSDNERRNNRIDFNDGFSIALKPYNLKNKDNMEVPGRKAKPDRYWTGIGDTGDHDKSRGGWVGNGKDDIGPEYNGFSVSSRAGESQNYRNALKNNYDDIKYFDEHPERGDSKTGKARAQRNVDQIHKWGKELLKKENKNMKLTEKQLTTVIKESVKSVLKEMDEYELNDREKSKKNESVIRLSAEDFHNFISESVKSVINEIGYHEKQKRDISDKEHEEWVRKKAEAKKRYYDSQKKDDKKDDSKAIDYYDYKHGKGNFPVMQKESFTLTETQLRQLISESVKKMLNELSPDLLIRARNAYAKKFGTGNKSNDLNNFVSKERYGNGVSYKDIFDKLQPEWEKEREKNGVKSDQNSVRTYRLKRNGEKDYISGHVTKFDDAISAAMHSPEYSDYLEKLTAGLDPLTAQAVKVYYPGDLDWDNNDMFDNYEHGYGEFGDSAEAEDEKGQVWKFYRDYNGHNEGGSIEVDEIEDITFESPDGKTGSIPSEFWYPNYKYENNYTNESKTVNEGLFGPNAKEKEDRKMWIEKLQSYIPLVQKNAGYKAEYYVQQINDVIEIVKRQGTRAANPYLDELFGLISPYVRKG